MADNCLPTDVNGGRIVQKRRAKKPKRIIEAGTSSEGTVWVGVPSECYDEYTRPRGKMHLFVLSPDEAEAVIEMLRENIDRVRESVSA